MTTHPLVVTRLRLSVAIHLLHPNEKLREKVGLFYFIHYLGHTVSCVIKVLSVRNEFSFAEGHSISHNSKGG